MFCSFVTKSKEKVIGFNWRSGHFSFSDLLMSGTGTHNHASSDRNQKREWEVENHVKTCSKQNR